MPLTPQTVLAAYRRGVFPMAEDAQSHEIFWVDPPRRAILPLDGLHIPQSLKKQMRRSTWRVTIDRDFDGVVAGCAARQPTWINAAIAECYGALAQNGYGHSVEIYAGEKLIGGLYGLRLGAAFFAESMFSFASGASKIALVALVMRLRAGGFTLLDCQLQNAHIQRFGVIEISRAQFHARLEAALAQQGDFYSLSENILPSGFLQMTGQKS